MNDTRVREKQRSIKAPEDLKHDNTARNHYPGKR